MNMPRPAPKFVMPKERHAVCDYCDRRMLSSRLEVIGRKVVCPRCKKIKKL